MDRESTYVGRLSPSGGTNSCHHHHHHHHQTTLSHLSHVGHAHHAHLQAGSGYAEGPEWCSQQPSAMSSHEKQVLRAWLAATLGIRHAHHKRGVDHTFKFDLKRPSRGRSLGACKRESVGKSDVKISPSACDACAATVGRMSDSMHKHHLLLLLGRHPSREEDRQVKGMHSYMHTIKKM